MHLRGEPMHCSRSSHQDLTVDGREEGQRQHSAWHPQGLGCTQGRAVLLPPALTWEWPQCSRPPPLTVIQGPELTSLSCTHAGQEWPNYCSLLRSAHPPPGRVASGSVGLDGCVLSGQTVAPFFPLRSTKSLPGSKEVAVDFYFILFFSLLRSSF